MKEKLSALDRRRAAGRQSSRAPRAAPSGPELRKRMGTYHLIGDALRGQTSPGIADRVVARLREEPTCSPRGRKRAPPGALAGTP